ncbi:phospholipase A(1) DAD1, chloroplastic-like [Impatiens glandulifera]|uniref:phospholipase A(1) DAD1, chloroplastic-like n=1 Tax=Impatiens glandulifera TaxID=253017 RepID=UPI001FB06899|nr:phospholipase A(1) DAD1, chloroplastic-like [Impatiens glandulifera]
MNKKWMEYQGIKNWEGLLDPLDENLRAEIIRYGHFVEAAYMGFNCDTSSSTYSLCHHPKRSLLQRAGFPDTGYKITKNLQATSSIQPPDWMKKAPRWTTIRSSWIGYVSVCTDKKEIARLGRRDVVIALRGTSTFLEWIENLRATLTPVSDDSDSGMVESGFLSLYTSRTSDSPSLQEQVREEIRRLLKTYGNETLSVTITGHSLGAALAILAAYDIKKTIRRELLVTVISFGGPRVGNRSFRNVLEQQGTKVLRIVNSDDLVTKLPGFVLDAEDNSYGQWAGIPGWLPWWVYAEVGRELRLSSRQSPHLAGINVATCHELGTYLQLVNGFVSSD